MMMTLSLVSLILEMFGQSASMSNIAGKMTPKNELPMAPTKEMNKSNLGMAAAAPTIQIKNQKKKN